MACCRFSPFLFFFSRRRGHTRLSCDWSSDVCSSDRSEEHTSELHSHDNLGGRRIIRSEEHTSELQSHDNLVCRLLLEKKSARQKRSRDGNPEHVAGLDVGSPGAPGAPRRRDPRPHLVRNNFFLKDGETPEFSPFPIHHPFPC